MWLLKRRFAVEEAKVGTIGSVTDRIPDPYCRGRCARKFEEVSGSRAKSKDLLRQCMLAGGSCTVIMMVLLLVVPAVGNGRSMIKEQESTYRQRSSRDDHQSRQRQCQESFVKSQAFQ